MRRITLPASILVSWKVAKLEVGTFAVGTTIRVDSVETLTIHGKFFLSLILLLSLTPRLTQSKDFEVLQSRGF